MDPLVVVEHITMLEHAALRAIPIRELQRLRFQKKPAEAAPNFVRLRDLHQRVVAWMICSVLQAGLGAFDDAQARANIISKLINMAVIAYSRFRNANTIVEVVSALSAAPVHRLRRSWALLPQRQLEALERLRRLVLSDCNYAALRAFQRAARLPSMPYLGLLLRDIVMVEQGPDWVAESELPPLPPPRRNTIARDAFSGIDVLNMPTASEQAGEPPRLINGVKMKALGRALLAVRRFQEVPYLVGAHSGWMHWLLESAAAVPFATEDARFAQSLILEPQA